MVGLRLEWDGLWILDLGLKLELRLRLVKLMLEMGIMRGQVQLWMLVNTEKVIGEY